MQGNSLKLDMSIRKGTLTRRARKGRRIVTVSNLAILGKAIASVSGLPNCIAHLRCVMVVQSRIQYLQCLAAAGHSVHVNFCSTEVGKSKVKIIVGPHAGVTSLASRSFIRAALLAVVSSIDGNVVVDRGHRHSDGTSITCIWISPVPGPASPVVEAPRTSSIRSSVTTSGATSSSQGTSAGLAIKLSMAAPATSLAASSVVMCRAAAPSSTSPVSVSAAAAADESKISMSEASQISVQASQVSEPSLLCGSWQPILVRECSILSTAVDAAVADGCIILVVLDHQGNETQFKVERANPLRKLMDAYCSRSHLQPSDVRWTIYEEPLIPEDAAEELGLTDNDVIVVARAPKRKNQNGWLPDLKATSSLLGACV